MTKFIINKKNILLILFFLFFNTIGIFAQNISQTNVQYSSAVRKFLKGNITDKTQAVREATGEDSIWLSNNAINFVLENKKYLGDDREMEGLAVAAVLSVTPDYISSLYEDNKTQYMEKLIQIFNEFSNSSIVQIAVISKIVNLQYSFSYYQMNCFTDLLNNYLLQNDLLSKDNSVIQTVISALGIIGDNVSFTILYNCLNDRKFAEFKDDIEETVTAIIPISMDEVLQIVHCKDIIQINLILRLIQRNSTISENYLSEIAENVLKESILLLGNSSDNYDKKQEIIELQILSIRILNQNKWTRASSTILSFFETAKIEFSENLMTEEQFIQIISSLMNIAPIDSVTPLIKYLGELNGQVEREQHVSQPVVLAVINTLGAIGDKTAFDSLLSVTYLDYSDAVLSAARKALAGLKW